MEAESVLQAIPQPSSSPEQHHSTADNPSPEVELPTEHLAENVSQETINGDHREQHTPSLSEKQDESDSQSVVSEQPGNSTAGEASTQDAEENFTELELDPPPAPPKDSPAPEDLPAIEPSASVEQPAVQLAPAPLTIEPSSTVEKPAVQLEEGHANGHHDSRPHTPGSLNFGNDASHRRSMTISQGHNVSVVLISTALETIAASKEAKRSSALRDSTRQALDLIKSNQGGDRPREIFEPLRLACETRNEKLMIASLDCISKLISYSFFAEPDSHLSYSIHSPPPSPHPKQSPSAAQSNAPQPSLVDLVAHTITACHAETTPDAVSLQIVKALLSLVLSPTILVHHSSLLKATRTVYNVFLLSTDPVNQMVAQGGLTQMVHHVLTRCKRRSGSRLPNNPSVPQVSQGSTSGPHLALPPPDPTNTAASTTFITQEAIQNSLPVIQRRMKIKL